MSIRDAPDAAFGEDPRPILVVLHQENSTPGRIGQMLASAGLTLDVRRPVLGDPLPETLDGHRGAVVFGGPPSANDPDAYLRREIDWIAVPLRENVPLLGICLGAQMLAKHLGAEVGPREDGLVEVGYYPLQPTEPGLAFMPHWPPVAYQWHREGFSLPHGAERLASSERFANQAIRYGRAFGVQFHAELTLAMMHRWTTRGHRRLVLPGAQGRSEHLRGRAIHDEPVRRWLADFLPRVFRTGEHTATAARQPTPARG